MTVSRRTIAAAALFASGASFVAGRPALAESGDSGAVEQAVETLRKAMLAADKAKLESLVADQLSYGHSGGTIQDKMDFAVGNSPSHGLGDFGDNVRGAVIDDRVHGIEPETIESKFF